MQGSWLKRVGCVRLLPQQTTRGNLLHAWLASSRLRTNRPQNSSCNKSFYNQMFRYTHIQDRQIHSSRARRQPARCSTKRPEKWPGVDKTAGTLHGWPAAWLVRLMVPLPPQQGLARRPERGPGLSFTPPLSMGLTQLSSHHPRSSLRSFYCPDPHQSFKTHSPVVKTVRAGIGPVGPSSAY